MSAVAAILSGMTEKLPTEAQAWASFWEALAPHLVQLHIEGKLPTDEVEPPPAE